MRSKERQKAMAIKKERKKKTLYWYYEALY